MYFDKSQFNNIYADTPIGIAICSEDGKIEMCNPRYRDIFGFSEMEKFIGYDIFSDPGFDKDYANTLKMTGTCSYKTLYTLPHERFPNCENSAIMTTVKITRLHKDVECTLPDGYIVYIVDHTSEVRDAKLHELEVAQRFQKLVENLPIEYIHARLILDDNNQITDYICTSGNKMSRHFYEHHGLVWGRTKATEFQHETAEDIVRELNKLRNEGRDGIFTYHIKELDLYKEMVAVFEGDNGYVSLISMDNTKLIKASMMEKMFLQNMSHEIRTPMNAIVGFSQILALPEGCNTDDERARYSDYITNNANMLIMLIDDILDVSAIESGTMSMRLSKMRINDVCRNAVKSTEYRCKPGVRMYFTSDLKDDYAINSDPKRIQQLLINYLSNATKHTDKGEIHLHCSLQENPGHITFSVTDTGHGIPEDKAGLIFERFVKLTDCVQGTGLGLNICQSIAKMLNGRVYLDTTYKGGARFIFEL